MAREPGRRGHPQGQDLLGSQLVLELTQLLVGHPVDAVHRTGVNRLLDQLGGIAILAERPGAAPIGLNHEGVGGHMGAVAAADTDSLINPDGLLAQAPAQ